MPRRSPRRTTRSPASKPHSSISTRAIGTTPTDSPPDSAPAHLFVGGKGGVGKTTCAAGIAVAAAHAGTRTLLVSIDPAHSLGDALGRPLGPEPARIPVRRGHLDAVEIDAASAVARWLETRRGTLEQIALRGTWLDAGEVARMLRLSLPGIDEIAALLEISRFASTGRYDLLVVDTAPTGHTLRMLQTPATLQALAGVFERMQARHRVVVESLRGSWQPDREDALISEIDDTARHLAAVLRDPAQVEFRWVTLPESMSVEEAADGVAALTSTGIAVSELIVNRVTSRPDRPCPWCDSRRIIEGQSIGMLRQRVPGVAMAQVSDRDVEPRGVAALAGIGSEIQAATPPQAIRKRAPPLARVAAVHGSPVTLPGLDELQLLLFGGKGGVGKTTCAAAAAVEIASSGSRRVLLLSTDPAHSLGDVLGAPVTDVAVPLAGGPPNLLVREVDAERAFRDVRERYTTSIDNWFDRLSRGTSSTVGVDAGYDRRIMHGLLELAPPGIDELTAVLEVTDRLTSGAGGEELVVMDTAPSGHALRLLEMPGLVQDWSRALMAILLKYQPVAGVGELGAVLLKVSQGVGRLKTLLTDPRRTAFIPVTRAAVLPVAETRRLEDRLRSMAVHVPFILVNAVGRGTCARCRANARREAGVLAKLGSEARGNGRIHLPVAIAPAQMPPPHGAGGLREWRSTWRSLRLKSR